MQPEERWCHWPTEKLLIEINLWELNYEGTVLDCGGTAIHFKMRGCNRPMFFFFSFFCEDGEARKDSHQLIGTAPMNSCACRKLGTFYGYFCSHSAHQRLQSFRKECKRKQAVIGRYCKCFLPAAVEIIKSVDRLVPMQQLTARNEPTRQELNYRFPVSIGLLLVHCCCVVWLHHVPWDRLGSLGA